MKAERQWLGTCPCDNERTIVLRKNALRAYEGKSSELIPPGILSSNAAKALFFLFGVVQTHPRIERNRLLCVYRNEVSRTAVTIMVGGRVVVSAEDTKNNNGYTQTAIIIVEMTV